MVPSSGKVLTGGVDANALQRPKRFFGAARNIEEGGSLTIIATALIDTGSRMDEVIFEEFKGTGNLPGHRRQIVLDRKLADKRTWRRWTSPARRPIGARKSFSSTRATLAKNVQCSYMHPHAHDGTADAVEFLLDKLKHSKNNCDFFDAASRRRSVANSRLGSGERNRRQTPVLPASRSSTPAPPPQADRSGRDRRS